MPSTVAGAITAAAFSLSLAAQQTSFEFEPIVGDPFSGAILAIDSTGNITTAGGRTVSLLDLQAIVARVAPKPRSSDRRGALVLRSGTRCGADFERGKGDTALFDTRFGPVELRIEHIASLRLAPTVEEDGGFERAARSPSATNDFVFAWPRGGGALKRYSMRVTGFDHDTVSVRVGGKERSLPVARVYGIVFGTDNGFAPDPLPQPTVTVHPSAGDPIRGKLDAWTNDRCVVRLAEGIRLRVDGTRIERIDVDSGRALRLAALEPSTVEHTPALNRPRRWLRDRTPRGAGIELGGKRFSSGLCLVPRTSLTFDVPPGFDVFETTVGIDDRAPRTAHATIRIRLDDRIVFDASAVTVGDDPRRIAVPLDGATSLTLETDFGKNLDLGDHCVFAGARLRKD